MSYALPLLLCDKRVEVAPSFVEQKRHATSASPSRNFASNFLAVCKPAPLPMPSFELLLRTAITPPPWPTILGNLTRLDNHNRSRSHRRNSSRVFRINCINNYSSSMAGIVNISKSSSTTHKCSFSNITHFSSMATACNTVVVVPSMSMEMDYSPTTIHHTALVVTLTMAATHSEYNMSSLSIRHSHTQAAIPGSRI